MNFDEHRPGWFCRATFPALILAVAALAGFWCAAGCEQRGEGTEQPPRQGDAGAEPAGVAPQQVQLRIVSLSPAVSRTLVDLGLDEMVVGRTPFCDAVDAGVQIVGDLHELNYEMLVQLQPTHVLVQPPASGPKPELVAECAARGCDLLTWHLNGLRDIEQMVRDIVQIVPGDSEGSEDVQARGEQMLAAIEALQSAEPAAWTGRVLLAVSVDPVLAFGTDTYLGEMLPLMGCENAMQRTGWVELSMEDVTRLAPEAIIIVNGDAKAAAGHVDRANGLQVPAVEGQRIAVLDHRDALLPCSAVGEVAAALRAIIDGFADAEADDS